VRQNQQQFMKFCMLWGFGMNNQEKIDLNISKLIGRILRKINNIISMNRKQKVSTILMISNRSCIIPGAFSKNGLNTIVALSNPNLKLGQENDGGLSEIDVKQLNAFYCGGDIATTGKPKPSVKLATTAKPVPVTTSEPYTIETSTTSEPASAMTPTTETFETSTEWTSSTKPAFPDLGSWFSVHDLGLRFFDDDSYDDTDYIK